MPSVRRPRQSRRNAVRGGEITTSAAIPSPFGPDEGQPRQRVAHPHGGRLHDDVRVRPGTVHGSVSCAALQDCRRTASSRSRECPVHDGDPCRACQRRARQRLPSRHRQHRSPPQSFPRGSTTPRSDSRKPPSVGVVADERFPFPLDAVDRASQSRHLGQPIQHRHDRDLVRHGDVAPRTPTPRNPRTASASASVLDLERDVAGIETGCGEGGLDHLLRRVAGHGPAQQRVERGCGCRRHAWNDATAIAQ